jgi:tRNA/rRNA methyltransferase
VQLIAYDWRRRWAASPVQPRTAAWPCRPMRGDRAGRAGRTGSEVLVQIGFLDPAAPKKLMPRLQQLINRARPQRRGGAHPARHRARRAARGCRQQESLRRRYTGHCPLGPHVQPPA